LAGASRAKPGLAGCNGLFHKHDTEDPLVGPGPKGLKADPGKTTQTRSGVPPVPAANSSASNADLAVGGQLAGGRPLGIDDRPGGANGWQGVGRDGQPVRTVGGGAADGGVIPAAGGVILRRPEPLVEQPPQVQPLPQAGTVGGLTPVPAIIYGQEPVAGPPGANPPAASPPAVNIDQLQEQLKARGVAWQRQEVTRDGVRVICALPDRANPDRQHIYEATAATPAAALQVVLAKIDQGR
jgi:hypothetical protein